MKIFLCFVLVASAASSALDKNLDPSEAKALQQGEMLVFTQENIGSSWPHCTIYQIVDCSPQELSKILTKYSNLKNVIPSIISAKEIEKGVVAYQVKFPVIKKIAYTVQTKVSKVRNTITVSWSLINSPFASAAEGSFEISEYKGRTLLKYTNSVTPSIIGAGTIKGQAIKEAKATVENIGLYVSQNHQ